jgi:glycosyltransferase involved in cell wall biosynthesis
MATSLILCTRNGGERLGTCLAHLDALDAGPDFELVIVDNGSDDGVSWPMIEAFAAGARHKTLALRCFRPGNSAGRNDGIAAASGDLLLFIDDDCYAAPDFVRAWERVFGEHGVGYGTGMVLRHDPAMSFLGCREDPEPRLLAPRRFVPAGFIQGSNMAFTRACLDRAGLFDERFGSGVPFAGEDWDISLRASFAGFAGGYFPEPKVSHDHRRPVSSIIASRGRFYEYGAGAVYAKHMRGRYLPELGLRFLRHIQRLRRRRDHGTELLASFLGGFRAYRAAAKGA